ncbi:MAG: GatB/YqeY domain-containing protein [Syntrophales bacterium]|nr:GatB/YqeY domain-containing protein [Syntrophales bacterium]MDD5531873.1 GatB/YqeY domain-containing protein [Syntrophales bacterium]HPL63919.1 GatB/YqeY domain-containing protein [Syntrophales bacterium]
MSLKERIDSDMIQAAKAKDKIRLSAIRMIKTAVHNREIDLKRPAEDTEILQVLSSLTKQRNDSIEQFRKGGREDLVSKETQELQIIKSFMPAEMSKEELEAEVRKVISETGAAGPKDMGKVMKAVMARVTGKADGKMVSEMVKSILSA